MVKLHCSNFKIITVFLLGVCFLFAFLFNLIVILKQLGSTYEPHHEKTCFMLYANNKDADQPAHPCSLISIFVVGCLDSILFVLAKS